MKKVIVQPLIVAVGLLSALVVVQLQADENPDPSDQIRAIGFLAGTWSGSMWDGEFVSYYSTAEGGKVLSYSELRREGKVAFHEFEKFDVLGGKVVFSPFPRGEPATQLTLTEIDSGNSRVVFENPKKDFPTRIVYHRVAKDNLVITLSDPYNNSEKVQKFDLKRVRS